MVHDGNKPSDSRGEPRPEHSEKKAARINAEASAELKSGKLNEHEQAIQKKKFESGSSTVTGKGDKHGTFRSAKDLIGDFAHTPLTKEAEAKRQAEFKTRGWGDSDALQGAKKESQSEHSTQKVNLAEKHQDGSYSLRINADLNPDQHARTVHTQVVENKGRESRTVFGELASGSGFRNFLESAKEAAGINPPTTHKQVHQATGDGSTLAKPVQNLGDVAQLATGSMVGFVKAVNNMMPALTPSGAIEGVKETVNKLGTFPLAYMRHEHESYADPIGTAISDAARIAEGYGKAVDWANERSQSSFAERGQDIGKAAPDVQLSAEGFIVAGRAMKSSELAKTLGTTIKQVESLTPEELAKRAEMLGVDIAKVEKVQGRLPLNWEYAGKNFTFGPDSEFAKSNPARAKELYRKYPEGVHFDLKGFADFDPYVARFDGQKIETQIKFTGSRAKDYELANQAFGWAKDETPKGFTWHHHQDGKTMQLIPSDLHNNVKHTGGCATSGLNYED